MFGAVGIELNFIADSGWLDSTLYATTPFVMIFVWMAILLVAVVVGFRAGAQSESRTVLTGTW
jgi:hypothetical protein